MSKSDSIDARCGTVTNMTALSVFTSTSAGVWPLGALLVMPYFYVKFIRQLLFFSLVNIGVTIIVLFLTLVIYRKKLGTNTIAKVKETKSESPSYSMDIEGNKKQQLKLEKVDSSRPNDRMFAGQHKATRTFILMLFVFLITYVPTIVSILYINICTKCNCVVVHAMRDVSFVFIWSSSVFRPLNFILTLKHLRNSVVRILKAEAPVNNGVHIDDSKKSNSDNML